MGPVSGTFRAPHASADAAVHQAHTELAAAVARARAQPQSWPLSAPSSTPAGKPPSSASDKIFQSSVDTGLLIGWPLRSVSPVSLARGASPVKERNSLAGAEPSGPTDDRGHRRGADLGQAGQAGRQPGRIGPA